MAPMFPLVDHRPRRRGAPGRAADRAPRLHRGRRPGPDRRTGHRGAAPRGRRRAGSTTRAAQGDLGGAGPRRSGTSGSLPFAHNVQAATDRARRRRGWCRTTRPGPTRPAGSSARLKTACGHRAFRVDHIGSTAVARPGRQGRHRRSGDGRVAGGRRRTRRCAAGAGYPASRATSPPTCRTPTIRRCGRSDFTAPPIPGRPTNVHLRVDGWPNQQFALLFVDWLNGQSRCAARSTWRSSGRRSRRPDYAEAKEPWFVDAYRRAWAWADATGWRP